MLGPWIEASLAPGVIVVVRCAGQTRYFPFGEADQARRRPVTAEAIFELASITKVFTTTSLAMEVDAGRMRLNDSVARHAPFLERQGKDIRRVTLVQLATHTSALPRVPDRRPPADGWNKRVVMEWLAEWRAKAPPGSRYLYSNVALGLLGFAIENREAKPLWEVWREQFLRPLGMHHTFFEIPSTEQHLVVQGYGPQGQPVEHSPQSSWPAGGRLSSSGHDMGEFLTANLGERADLPAITKAMRLAQQPQFRVSDQLTLGMGWQRVKLKGELVIDKNGGLAGT
ncbi:MAG TPA: serine hydrolase, partial [Pirellulales bacterium]|nr:serine hydrolase [Pirellulales bacterium]